MQRLQPLGLRQQFLRRGNDDDHIYGCIGVVVLIGDAIYQLRNKEDVAAEVGCWSRRGHGQRKIVKTHS